jgi:anti-sigma factor RsiW
MRCEDVRPLLPELAGGVPERAAEVEAHLGSCAACSAELGRYRATMHELSALREDLVEPPIAAVERALARVPAWRWRLLSRRVVVDERLRYAALSLGGVMVGAVVIGLLRRRAVRREMALITPASSP